MSPTSAMTSASRRRGEERVHHGRGGGASTLKVSTTAFISRLMKAVVTQQGTCWRFDLTAMVPALVATTVEGLQPIQGHMILIDVESIVSPAEGGSPWRSPSPGTTIDASKGSGGGFICESSP